MRLNMEESYCDTMSKVSCCVKPTLCFKNSDFDALSTPIENEFEYGLSPLSSLLRFYMKVWLIYIHKKKPRLHFGESFALIKHLILRVVASGENEQIKSAAASLSQTKVFFMSWEPAVCFCVWSASYIPTGTVWRHCFNWLPHFHQMY